MNFKIGDAVVHWTHGLGTVAAIEEMQMAGVTQQYYVVEVKLFKIWVPVDEANHGSLRFPTESMQFQEDLDILQTPGEQLPENQYQRKNELRERMQKSTLGGLVRVIRDLTDRSRQHNLNQNDSIILDRAEENLIDEWVLSLGAERPNALHDLKALLQRDPIALKE